MTDPATGADDRRIEYRDLKTLRADPRNPKAHAAEAIGASVSRFGFIEPIVVDERTGFIASGHGRVSTLTQMRMRGDAPPRGVRVTSKGAWQVPVVSWRSKSDAEAGAALIALNRTTELGGWVDESLLALLDEIERDEAVGFDDDALEDLRSSVGAARAARAKLSDPDDVPTMRKSARSRLGDVWQLGAHRVICGDATDPSVLDALMAGDRADVLWTDPPYGVSYVGKTGDALTIQNDGADDLRGLLEPAFSAARGALRPGAPFYVAAPPGPLQHIFESSLIAAGYDWRQILVWVKNALVLGRSDYHYRHESILYGFAPAPKGHGRLGRGGRHWHGDNRQTTVAAVDVPTAKTRRGNATLRELCKAIIDGLDEDIVVDPVELVEALFGGGMGSTVFEVDKPTASREHPTMKPTALIKAHLSNSARAGQLVLDLFGGSGSTLIACEALGMGARVVELDPLYVDVIVDRWEAVTGKKGRRA